MIFITNLLTILRILLAPIIFVFIAFEFNFLLSLILFLFAGLTDYFDGYIARKYNATSTLGEILDPIADKILVIFLFFGLAINLSSYIIGFAASIIITREIWISALRDLNSRTGNESATKVTYLAKIKTSVQMFSIFIYLVGLALKSMILVVIGDIFIIIAVLITVYTGYEYTLNSFKKE